MRPLLLLILLIPFSYAFHLREPTTESCKTACMSKYSSMTGGRVATFYDKLMLENDCTCVLPWFKTWNSTECYNHCQNGTRYCAYHHDRMCIVNIALNLDNLKSMLSTTLNI